jgi:hypothetical protein
MTEFILRACCAAPGARGGSIEIAGSRAPHGSGEVRRLDVTPAPRNVGSAHHEAAHGAAAYVFGVPVAEISIDPPNPQIRYHPVRDDQWFPDPLPSAIISLSGPAGEGIPVRREWREHPEFVATTLARVAHGAMRCDWCKAARSALKAAGGDEAEATAVFRRAEDAAWTLIRNFRVRRLIGLTAERLMQEGTITGEDFHALASEIVDPETIAYLRNKIEKEI